MRLNDPGWTNPIAAIAFLLGFSHNHITIATVGSALLGFIVLIIVVVEVAALAFALVGVILFALAAMAFLTADVVRRVTRSNNALVHGLCLGLLSACLSYAADSPYPMLIWIAVHIIGVPILSAIMRDGTSTSTYSARYSRATRRFAWRSADSFGRLLAAALALCIALACGAVAAVSVHDTVWHHRDAVDWRAKAEPLRVTTALSITEWHLGHRTHRGLLLRPTVSAIEAGATPLSRPLYLALKSPDTPRAPRKNIWNLSLNLAVYDEQSNLVYSANTGVPFINGYAVMVIIDEDKGIM